MTNKPKLHKDRLDDVSSRIEQSYNNYMNQLISQGHISKQASDDVYLAMIRMTAWLNHNIAVPEQDPNTNTISYHTWYLTGDVDVILRSNPERLYIGDDAVADHQNVNDVDIYLIRDKVFEQPSIDGYNYQLTTCKVLLIVKELRDAT